MVEHLRHHDRFKECHAEECVENRREQGDVTNG